MSEHGVGYRRNGKRRMPMLLIFIPLLSAACTVKPDPAQISEGDSRVAIVQTYGEPAGQRQMTKRDEVIWGPIEDFWSEVPMESRVEIWTYRVDEGDVELYFVDDSPTVDGVGFAPEGVVYEAVQD